MKFFSAPLGAEFFILILNNTHKEMLGATMKPASMLPLTVMSIPFIMKLHRQIPSVIEVTTLIPRRVSIINGISAYNEGQRGWGLFGAIAGGARKAITYLIELFSGGNA